MENPHPFTTHPEFAFPGLVHGFAIKTADPIFERAWDENYPTRTGGWYVERFLETHREEVDRYYGVWQVHGDKIIHLRDLDQPPDEIQADGMITDLPGVALGVKTADCLPVFLYDPDRPAIAGLHAGWRSGLAGIVEKGAGMMREAFGSHPESLRMIVGPGICADHFEVGADVAEDFRKGFGHQVIARTVGDKSFIDLPAVVGISAHRAGMVDTNIVFTNLCTFCDERAYFSHRRDLGRTGRHIHFIALARR